jgi:hypothetical protein
VRYRDAGTTAHCILWHRRFGASWVRTAWIVLLVICTWRFCRGCPMQFTGSCATSGRDTGFCITITHRATFHLCSNSWPR